MMDGREGLMGAFRFFCLIYVKNSRVFMLFSDKILAGYVNLSYIRGVKRQLG